ncbi:hypothetical protein PLICRDRAFT_172347 [Plicaturopsis crispa FD-325 SS-3]|nr:hypothetical protein PLICRDRAFT_172347 [Plicaturopsis crispa FD-325 SS-3]
MPVNDLLRHRMQPVATVVNSHRILLYSLVSTLAVTATIANALKNHSNFYSVAIYLSKSNRSVLILANFAFILALMGGRVVQQIFFGPLRASEVERLYDRLWFFVTESLLAFTIFRDEFDIPFGLMFGFLLFVKSFHWLASDRIEWMDQRPYPGPPLLFHIRMNALFFLLWTTDFAMFLFAVDSIATNGVGGMVLFASEYTILMASALNTISKYVLSVLEIRRARSRGGENAPPWENKSMYIFYVELLTDFLKLSTYLTFFTLIITFYGLPLNIVRDVYVTARSFITRLRALHRYQTATRNMDQRYPNATEAEMTAMSDRTCIICREEMILRTQTAEGDAAIPPPDGPNTTPKKLPCGHIFHFYCLRSWLERQQSCPTCRRTVLENAPQPAPGAGGAARPQQPPRPPNFFGFPGAQAGQQQPPANNAYRFINRFLGLPAQQPIPLPPHQHHQQQPNAGTVTANPPGVTIHIQYQIRQQQQPQPLPPQNLQPPPAYAGFQGAGGAWQPWGMDQRWFEPRNPAPAHGAQDAPTPTPTQPSAPVMEQATPSPAPTPTQPSAESADETPNPREAAARAALRRFNTTQSPDSSEAASSSSPSSGVATSSSGASASGLSHAPPILHTPQPSSDSEPSDSVPQSEAELEGTARLDIPTLIPLYDPQPPRADPRPSRIDPTASRVDSTPSPPAAGPSSHAGSQNSQARRHDALWQPRQPPSAPASQPEAGPSNAAPTAADLVQMDQLQLAHMDRVTREAIDERLRVLEGVSTTLYNCMNELMRMRSSLPVLPSAGAGTRADATRLDTDSHEGRTEDLSTTERVEAPSRKTTVEDVPESESLSTSASADPVASTSDTAAGTRVDSAASTVEVGGSRADAGSASDTDA